MSLDLIKELTGNRVHRYHALEPVVFSDNTTPISFYFCNAKTNVNEVVEWEFIKTTKIRASNVSRTFDEI